MYDFMHFFLHLSVLREKGQLRKEGRDAQRELENIHVIKEKGENEKKIFIYFHGFA